MDFNIKNETIKDLINAVHIIGLTSIKYHRWRDEMTVLIITKLSLLNTKCIIFEISVKITR